MPGAFWQASMGSFIRKSRRRASSSSIELLHVSEKETLPSPGSAIPGHHIRNKGYLKRHNVRHFGNSDPDTMRTEIWEEGAPPRTLEKSVVLKPVATHQSKREEQSDVEGWDNESSGV